MSIQLPKLTDDERKAALRFCETCEDGQAYDVPKPMMRRLAELSLVTHKGRGVYEGTALLDLLQEAAAKNAPIKDDYPEAYDERYSLSL